MKHGEIKIVEFDSNTDEIVIFGLDGKLISSGVTVDSISGGGGYPEESVTLTYNISGSLETITGATVDKTFTYDIEGRLETVVDARSGITKTLSYDGEGRLIGVTVT